MLHRLRQALAHVQRTRRRPFPAQSPIALPLRTERLFSALHPHDREHLEAVAQALAERGTSEDLITAGLLHDIGKVSYSGATVGLPARALKALLLRTPLLLNRLASPVGMTWRVSLWRLAEHAELGADRLKALGWSPRIVHLVREHERGGDDPERRLLRAVDASTL